MSDLWRQAVHGSRQERIAVWAGVAAIVLAFTSIFGWWTFALRAGIILYGATWAAHWLTEQLNDDWPARIVGWFLAGLVILVALVVIFIAAFDGDGAP